MHSPWLPSNFLLPFNLPSPPAPVSLQTPGNLSSWQHHHYTSALSAAAFPQSQDRYICQTCNKAFSRPSILRIHSQSHMGEKPFKCPHAGCGNAFSVRSNMKRHERACHTTASPFGVDYSYTDATGSEPNIRARSGIFETHTNNTLRTTESYSPRSHTSIANPSHVSSMQKPSTALHQGLTDGPEPPGAPKRPYTWRAQHLRGW
ncbi:zinc finger protein [Neofusicoccum parvum]|uniref:Zinc finger protein n=1 Tax=Neofusicoccum parvum TaxID=310453 RepID=A0ACB5RUP4_9PEZI|nr:zinc finger protein [Neofusicoccum parvum]